jgi:transglutaminase-like putative cysteine protease
VTARRLEEVGDSWVAVALRVFVAAAAALAATWQAATDAGMIAAAAGAATGVVAGEVVGRSRRARLTVAYVLAAVLLLAGAAAWELLTRWAEPSVALGAGRLIAAADAALLALTIAGVCTALRATSVRVRAMSFVELAIFGAALATPLAAHRGGSINRPLPIGDYAWSQGEDPVVYLQLAGGVAAVGLSLFLVAERRWVRALAAAVLVVVASLGLGYLASLVRPPDMRPDTGLGMMGRGNEEGEGGSKGSRSLDQLDFRDNYDSERRSAPVAVVLLHDDYDPPNEAYYLRQNAFSRYNGRRMVPALDTGVDADVFDVFPAARKTAAWVPPPDLRVPVETSVALLQDHTNPIVLEAAESVAPAKNPSPRRFRRAYLARSLALDVSLLELLGRPVGDPTWSPETRRLYLEGPTDPRYADLARRLVERLPPDLREDRVARAIAITDDLGQRGTYSLRSRHAGAADPTASFLFGDMTGYCVHFAHAAVYLLRAADVPARLATGYHYPAKQRGRGSSLLLRGADAHAWPELFVAGVGWVVVDVSPARNLEPPGSPLDPELQRLLGEMLRGQLEDQRTASLEIGDAPRAVAEILDILRSAAAALGLLALVAALLLYVGKAWRRAAPALVGPSGRTRLAYRAALDALGDCGLRRERGEPPEAFARRLADRVPSLGALVALASARAFGSARPADPDVARALGRAVRREARRAAPWWRRLLGVLDPTSWLWSR